MEQEIQKQNRKIDLRKITKWISFIYPPFLPLLFVFLFSTGFGGQTGSRIFVAYSFCAVSVVVFVLTLVDLPKRPLSFAPFLAWCVSFASIFFLGPAFAMVVFGVSLLCANTSLVSPRDADDNLIIRRVASLIVVIAFVVSLRMFFISPTVFIW